MQMLITQLPADLSGGLFLSRKSQEGGREDFVPHFYLNSISICSCMVNCAMQDMNQYNTRSNLTNEYPK